MLIEKIEKENVTCEIHNTYVKVIYGPKNTHVNLDTAKKMVFQRQQVTKNKKFAMLVDTRNLANLDTNARKYWATDEAIKDVKYGAILVESLLGSVVGNFYIKINKPPVNTVLFTKEEEAIKWLNSEFLKEKESSHFSK